MYVCALSGSASTESKPVLPSVLRQPSVLLEYWERPVDRLSDKLRGAPVELPRDRETGHAGRPLASLGFAKSRRV